VAENSITITDNRTGRTTTAQIEHGVFPSAAIRELDKSLFMYDPAFLSTASCASTITDLDGTNGILRYRGYPIEQLAEKSTFLEVAYLLINGELPDKVQHEQWVHDITYHTYIHENIANFMRGFNHDAHPMGMLVSIIGAMSTFYPEAKDIDDPHNRLIQMTRVIAKLPTIAAFTTLSVYPASTRSITSTTPRTSYG